MGLPTYQEIVRIKKAYIETYDAWCKQVPGYIVKSIHESNSLQRIQIFEFLAGHMAKLHQDMHATFVLLDSNHIGPATAMSRILRDNALEMLVCAFDDPQNDGVNLHYLCDMRTKDNARMLRKICDTFENKPNLAPVVKERIKTSRTYADEVLKSKDSFPDGASSVFTNRKGFRNLTEVAIDLLDREGLDLNLVVPQALDYWMECEAVHPGRNTQHLYEPGPFTGDEKYDLEIAAIYGVRVIYPMKVVITATLLKAGGILRKIELPDVSNKLAEIAEVAETVVISVVRNCRTDAHD